MDVNQTPITLTMPLEKINLIINALAKLPFEAVAETINDLRIAALNTLKEAEEAERAKQAQASLPIPPSDDERDKWAAAEPMPAATE